MKLFVSACAFFISVSAFAFDCPPRGAFQALIEQHLGKDTAERSTSFGLALVDSDSGQILCEEYVQRDQNIYPASAIKTLIGLAVLRGVDRGEINLSQAVAISQPNAKEECKHWGCATYGPGHKVQISKLLEDMITVSNNIATNQLIDLATKSGINAIADELGTPELRIVRKVYDDVNPEPEIQDRNHATSGGLVSLYREIVSGRLKALSEESRKRLIETLGRQTINGSLNGRFPKDVKFYHKTGNTSEVTADGGFYYLPGSDSRVAVILVGLQGFAKLGELTGFETLRRIGEGTLKLTREPVPAPGGSRAAETRQ